MALLLGAELNAEIEHASPYGKDPGERVPGEKRVVGPRAQRLYEEKRAKGEIPIKPIPDERELRPRSRRRAAAHGAETERSADRRARARAGRVIAAKSRDEMKKRLTRIDVEIAKIAASSQTLVSIIGRRPSAAAPTIRDAACRRTPSRPAGPDAIGRHGHARPDQSLVGLEGRGDCVRSRK